MPSIDRLRALPDSGCFVIPNPWDVGSARLLAHAGFHALATSSAGLAFTLGRPDSLDSRPLAAVLTESILRTASTFGTSEQAQGE